MPYRTVADLPSAVKDALPAEAQSVFLRVFNAQKSKDLTDERAFATAWTAVRNGWEKTSAGDWVRKSAPNVDAILAAALELPDQDPSAFGLTSKILKLDTERRLVGGWASVVHDGTSPVVDIQGDVIEIDDLRKAVHEFVKVRVGKAMHDGDQVAELVELAIVDEDLRSALGAPAGPLGAWAVWKVTDEATWSRVKSGELGAFSIGGRGRRAPIPEP